MCRWAGLYGVDADFVADKNSKICLITVDDIKVRQRALSFRTLQWCYHKLLLLYY